MADSGCAFSVPSVHTLHSAWPLMSSQPLHLLELGGDVRDILPDTLVVKIVDLNTRFFLGHHSILKSSMLVLVALSRTPNQVELT